MHEQCICQPKHPRSQQQQFLLSHFIHIFRALKLVVIAEMHKTHIHTTVFLWIQIPQGLFWMLRMHCIIFGHPLNIVQLCSVWICDPENTYPIANWRLINKRYHLFCISLEESQHNTQLLFAIFIIICTVSPQLGSHELLNYSKPLSLSADGKVKIYFWVSKEQISISSFQGHNIKKAFFKKYRNTGHRKRTLIESFKNKRRKEQHLRCSSKTESFI